MDGFGWRRGILVLVTPNEVARGETGGSMRSFPACVPTAVSTVLENGFVGWIN